MPSVRSPAGHFIEMRTVALLCPLLICVISVQAAPPQRKFESADVDRVLSNERILTNYIRCLMDEGACTQEARDLKKLLPDVISSGCAKCTEKQRATTQKVVRHLQNKRPADWSRLTAKYDPSGQLRKQYEQTNGPTPAAPAPAPAPAAPVPAKPQPPTTPAANKRKGTATRN